MAVETYRTYVICDDGNMYLIDTIEHEDGLWLVPKWNETPYPSMQKPARMIQLPKERVRDLGHDFLGSGIHARKLDDPMPKAVLDGTSREDWPLDVQEAPDLLIRRP
ncbi:MAG: hypothetical protein AB7O50_05225 [Pseudolabrys sp.]